jgi:putative aminopeptidase FrvX
VLRAAEYFSLNRPDSTIIFSLTVLEEFSSRGSLPTVNRTKPHAIISVDITVAADTPIDEKNLNSIKLGNGPAIKMMDFHGRGTLGGLFSSPPLRRYIERVASSCNISLQREVIVGVITDPAFQIYLGEEGYIVAGISIPQRYTHAANHMIHEHDLQKTLELIIAAASNFNQSIVLSSG